MLNNKPRVAVELLNEAREYARLKSEIEQHQVYRAILDKKELDRTSEGFAQYLELKDNFVSVVGSLRDKGINVPSLGGLEVENKNKNLEASILDYKLDYKLNYNHRNIGKIFIEEYLKTYFVECRKKYLEEGFTNNGNSCSKLQR